MHIEDTHTVTASEAEYKLVEALIPFLMEDGTPVAIRRDGWLLMVSTSIAGPPHEATKEYREDVWRKLADAATTYTYASGKTHYTTAIVVPELGTWWASIEACH